MLAVAAVLVAAVTAVQLRAEIDYERAQSELFAGGAANGSAGIDVERVRDRLERARSVRPGTTATIAQAFLEQNAGRRAEAEALARQATRREPDNADTWHALLSTARDAGERESARRMMLSLDPLRGDR